MRSSVLCEVVGVLAAGLLVAGSAFGIGPDYQVTPDTFDNLGNFTGVPAPWGTLNDMVELEAGTTNDPDEVGSGTVIGVKPDPTAAGVMDVAILTANHVASPAVNDVGAITLASFGAGINTPAPFGYGAWALTLNVLPTFQTFTLVDPVNNPGNAPEDLSIVEAQVMPAGLANPGPVVNPWNAYAKAEWGLVAGNVINPVAWPSPIPAASATNAAVNTLGANVPFSISGGFGLGGQFNGANNTYTQTAPTLGVRRFLNGTVNTTIGASVKNGAYNVPPGPSYFEPLVQWPIQAPSAAGGGTTFGGDSGSAYLVNGTNPVSILVTNVDNINYTNAIPGYITLNNTLDEGAVHVGGATAKVVGNTNIGVPLVYGQSLDWAQLYATSPYLIPEPSSIYLVVLGALALLPLARSRFR
jgi:hypothetical protein